MHASRGSHAADFAAQVFESGIEEHAGRTEACIPGDLLEFGHQGGSALVQFLDADREIGFVAQALDFA
jgi:hypothetical protein